MDGVLRIQMAARRAFVMRIPILPRILNRLNRLIYSCEIPYTVDLSRSVRFPHKALGVVIGDGVVIREGCRILQNVTIGGRAGSIRAPVLESRVLVGAGACILGEVTIGTGARVGANAVVLDDVPPGATVVGIPARLVGVSSRPGVAD